MKPILNTISDFYGAMRLDLRYPPAGESLTRHPGVVGLLAVWHERACFREELALKARYTPYLIGDIGLTMDEVREELAKPFWRR
ncbi:hypothetical protein [Mesorhizobium sp. B2-6-2]|uniref:DUF1127 domain-containing protein n=1 Tax=Mesorhizobium sp. B2-6-2 TaxID=2589915 RepID=UPI001128FC73|nr:hypothetical protein [Mesorhizobium sp. B2-6-2]TPJ73625.1 hypothetical protein FJ419_25240 [Mesorhizobium sp. B2-6-2]